MKTKYDFDVENIVVAADRKRLTNQLWKLIPMRENDEDWVAHLRVVIEELSGLYEVLGGNNLDLFIILTKLEGLTSESAKEFMIYRKTVFRCIELLSGVLKDE